MPASWEELDAYRRRILGYARAYLRSLADGELLTPREMNVDGETLLYCPADIFVHAVMHERQHVADLKHAPLPARRWGPIVGCRFSLPENLA
jgi:hypothetical protein